MAKAQKKIEEKPLNFRVSAEFHRAFKTYAAQHGMSMRQLLELGFELVKKKQRP
jgi:predicted HicB family RNase H-like nuclease